MKSLSIYDYIEFKHPTYTYLRIVPCNAVRNNSTDKIVSLVAGLYTNIFQRVERVNKKLFFKCEAKASYYIYIERTKVEFYFIVPRSHYLLFKEKIIDSWSNKITIEEVNKIPSFSDACSKSYQSYSKSDALSLSCDKRSNVLLSGVLNTLHMMADGDKVGVLYNFVPYHQQQWHSHYDRTIQSIKDGFPITKNKMLFYVSVASFVLDKLMDIALSTLISKKQKPKPKSLGLSEMTRKKREQMIVQTQILCMSESEDRGREVNNLTAVGKAFECLDSDNRLIPCRKKNIKLDFTSCKIKGIPTNLMSVREAQNLVACPGRELLTEHKVINSIKVLETPVPDILQGGYIRLGNCKYKDSNVNAFQRDKGDPASQPLTVFGEQGSGKTTYLGNYVKDIQVRGEGAIVIDYIKNCELSDTIKKGLNPNNVIDLDMSKLDSIQGFGYNELNLNDKMYCANQKAEYIEMLVDAINTDDPLKSRMSKYLNAASNIVFLFEDTSFRNVIDVLENHEIRAKAISSIPEKLSLEFREEISALKELDDYNRSGELVGTKSDRIDGILHRVNTLKKNYMLKKMFYKDCSSNIDLVKAMDEGKVVLIRLPEQYFSTPYVKNILTTYFLTKVWSAMLMRSGQKDPRRFHTIIDEIFQAHTAMELLRDKEILPQTRKWHWKFVLTSQSIEKIKMISDTMYSAGSSYMFLKGTAKSTYEQFKEELSPYTLEDFQSLPQYSSLNLINTEKGRFPFITKLPYDK